MSSAIRLTCRPTDAGNRGSILLRRISTRISKGTACTFIKKEGKTIVGAMAVTMFQGEDYHAIAWSQELPDDEVTVIHILAVNPDYHGRGIGAQLVSEAISLAKANGMKAIRLDALASNLPAHKLYERLGFVYRGKQHLYAANTGWTDFFFFEHLQF